MGHEGSVDPSVSGSCKSIRVGWFWFYWVPLSWCLVSPVLSQLPYHELEKLNGIDEVKQYLHQKLLDVPL